MDVKKAIGIAIGVIVAVGLGILIVNLVFGTNIIQNAFNGLGQYINDFWQELTGSSIDIFEDVSVTQRSAVNFP